MEMARKPRLEFAGAIYHVFSRGNYRKELFDDSSARLFEKTLLQVSASAAGCSMREQGRGSVLEYTCFRASGVIGERGISTIYGLPQPWLRQL